jgi:DNA (cytosine-5)-methyltransferase 1
VKIGSLFSGIGGLELGLERAGCGRTVWQCEIDPYARAVLAKHWPDAQRFDDITKMHDVPPVDLICGGFPCQDISNAGKRAGIEGARSGLFYELMRVVRLVRPRFVVLENVAALLGRGMGDVLGELSESGYDAEWDCIPASAVGAHHRRDRVFIIGIMADANNVGMRTKNRSNCGCERESTEASESAALRQGDREARIGHARTGRANVADAESGKTGSGLAVCWRQSDACESGTALADADQRGQPRRSIDDAGWGAIVGAQRDRGWTPEPSVGRVAHGVPSRVDRLKCLGNAVVPAVAEVAGRRLLEIRKRIALP